MGRLIKYNNNSISAVTATGLATGSMVLIKEQTASASASISFVNGSNGVVLDGTYNTYIFKFINIRPSIDGADFQFNFSTDGGSNYNVTKTSTIFQSYQSESGLNPTLNYDSDRDLAQSTAYQVIMQDPGNASDEGGSGTFNLFAPSSTTYVKHFISDTHEYQGSDYAVRKFLAGYANTTSAINAIDFKFASGNIDDGTIKLYGIRES